MADQDQLAADELGVGVRVLVARMIRDRDEEIARLTGALAVAQLANAQLRADHADIAREGC